MAQVRVDLVVDQKGTAAAGMKDLATATTQAANATRQLKVEQARGGGGGAGGGAGGLPQDLVTGARVMAAVQLATAGLSGLAKSIDVLGNSALSTTQKTRAVAEAIPVIGQLAGALFQLADSFSHVTGLLRVLNEESVRTRAAAGARLQADAVVRAETFAQRSRQTAAEGAAAGAAERLPLPAFGETAAERQRFQEASRLLPFQRAAVTAGAEERTLGRQVQEGRAGITRTEADLDAARLRRDALLAEARQPANTAQERANQAQALNDAEKEGVKVARERAKWQDQVNQQKQLEQDYATKSLATGKAQIDTDRERLAILKEQEQRLTGQLQAFGALRPGQQRLVARFAQQLEERGFESLTEAQRAMMGRGGFGGALSLAAERSAQQNPLFAEAQGAIFRAGLGEAPQDVAGLREQIRGLTGDLDVNMAKYQENLTKALSKALADIGAKIMEMTDAAVEDAKQEAERQIIQRRNQGGGP